MPEEQLNEPSVAPADNGKRRLIAPRDLHRR